MVLVRHGQSTWNAEGRIQGSSNAAVLTEKGKSQALKAANYVRGCLVQAPCCGALHASHQIRRCSTCCKRIRRSAGLCLDHDCHLHELLN